MKNIIVVILFNIFFVNLLYAKMPEYRITKDEYATYLATSEELRKAQVEHDNIYNNLLRSLNKNQRKLLIKEQISWIIEKEKKAYYTAPKGSPEYIGILVNETQSRTLKLKEFSNSFTPLNQRQVQEARAYYSDSTTNNQQPQKKFLHKIIHRLEKLKDGVMLAWTNAVPLYRDFFKKSMDFLQSTYNNLFINRKFDMAGVILFLVIFLYLIQKPVLQG